MIISVFYGSGGTRNSGASVPNPPYIDLDEEEEDEEDEEEKGADNGEG